MKWGRTYQPGEWVELETKYNARINGKFIREAAQYYEVRKKLKGDN